MDKTFVMRKGLLHTVLLVTVIIFGSSFSTNALAKRSPEEVFKYQKHMAQAGYPSAIYKLAVMYQNGYGTPRDLKQALKLYKDAASLGNKKAESRISEVEIMIESGDFGSNQKSAKQKALEEEQARIEAEKEKLRQERQALSKAQRDINAARLEEQRRQRQQELAKKRAEQQRISDERRKLNEEMAKLRKERIDLAREQKALAAAKELEAEEEMRALEEATIMLMDEEGLNAEERATIELMTQ
ncbi:MAG: hypothetical protein OQK78_07825 [Gammaproteobacteria bacterium]|nr:hypothetical protein [Gammaproteobacteria bacterium]